MPRVDRAVNAQALGKALDPDGDGVFFSEHRIRRANDGALRWITAWGQTTFEGDPLRPVAMRGVCADVTEHREAWRDRRASAAHISGDTEPGLPQVAHPPSPRTP